MTILPAIALAGSGHPPPRPLRAPPWLGRNDHLRPNPLPTGNIHPPNVTGTFACVAVVRMGEVVMLYVNGAADGAFLLPQYAYAATSYYPLRVGAGRWDILFLVPGRAGHGARHCQSGGRHGGRRCGDR